jgi:hypothetical protein
MVDIATIFDDDKCGGVARPSNAAWLARQRRG